MPARRAFTRVELLVVAVVLVVGLGLLVSAVGQVRRAADAGRCQNNLKQLGLAALNYQSANGHYPPGTAPGTSLLPDRRLSVHILLMPYIESQPVFARLALTEPWDSERNAATLAEWPPRLNCPPTDDRTEWARGALVPTNYVGVAGLGADAAMLPDDDPRIGMFGYDRKLKPEQVKDGLANTALFVETTRDVGPWARGGPGTVRGVVGADRPLAGPGRPFGGLHHLNRSLPWKELRGGSNVGLADGSVRSLRDDTDPAVLLALATAAGGEADLPAW